MRSNQLSYTPAARRKYSTSARVVQHRTLLAGECTFQSGDQVDEIVGVFTAQFELGAALAEPYPSAYAQQLLGEPIDAIDELGCGIEVPLGRSCPAWGSVGSCGCGGFFVAHESLDCSNRQASLEGKAREALQAQAIAAAQQGAAVSFADAAGVEQAQYVVGQLQQGKQS